MHAPGPVSLLAQSPEIFRACHMRFHLSPCDCQVMEGIHFSFDDDGKGLFYCCLVGKCLRVVLVSLGMVGPVCLAGNRDFRASHRRGSIHLLMCLPSYEGYPFFL